MPDRRVLAAGWVGYALLFATYAVLTPYLQLYLGARGFAASRIGLLLGSFELAGIAGPILVTLLADRLQRYRRFIALSLLGSVACFLLLHAIRPPAMAFPLVVGLGFFYRSAIPLTDALFGRLLDDPARQYGFVRVAGSAGFLATSLVLQLTGWVSGARPGSILAAFAVLAVPAALAAGVLPAVPRTTRSDRRSAPEAAPPPRSPAPDAVPRTPAPAAALAGAGFDARFWAVIAVLFLARFGISAYYSFFSLYLRDTFAVANVSAIWAIGAAAEVPMILFSGRIMARFGVRATLTAAVAAVTVRLALYGLFPVLAVVVPAQLLHALTFGALHTASVAYVNAKIDASRRGLGMAVYNALSIGLASFIASGLGGYLVEEAGYRGLFLVYAAVPVLGLAVLAARGRRLFALSPHRSAASQDGAGRPCA
jgi:PPP family 3-phenylpropionic acid transporter